MKQNLRIPLLLALVGLAAALIYAAVRVRQAAPPEPPVQERPTVGFVDTPAQDVLDEAIVKLNGWALDADGIDKVEAVLDKQLRLPVRYGIPRPDVAQAHPAMPDSAAAGFSETLDLSAHLNGRHELSIEVTDRHGARTVIARKTLIATSARQRWAAFAPAAVPDAAQRFFVLFATSGVAGGGAAEVETLYAPFVSRSLAVGIRVPILYLRTTRGRGGDWNFDPAWDTGRKCGDKSIAEDGLTQVIDYAVHHRLPVLFTLNGGVWADARCDVPEWDINDELEKAPANCQWNEANQVLPDDALEHLPGSEGSPQLARMLTYNVYAKDVRRYKKRNLQQAARVIGQFSKQHPELFAGINLDPDVYMNPFFDSPKRWHDYNPQTLRQFREWLQGSGPYAGQTTDGAPDLSRYRRPRPLTLKQVRKLAGEKFASWKDVDPPRVFPARIDSDPWIREWELFRRHLVDLHYDELSVWLRQAGIDRRFIFSSQGFLAPRDKAMPFAVRLDSPVRNYDSGGMSVEGSAPRDGHLGAILYGASATNDIPMESDKSLFATFRDFDPDWGAVEYNTADFREPRSLPPLASAYRSLRDLFNYGARFVSPMAWNGSNGLFADDPGFAAFTSVRNTPLETGLRDFLLARVDFPRGGLLWTFGAAGYANGDGWTAQQGQLQLGEGRISVVADPATGQVTLLSPEELDVRRGRHAQVVIGLAKPEAVARIEVFGSSIKDSWFALASVDAAGAQRSAAGLHIPMTWRAEHAAQRLRIVLGFKPGSTSARIEHLALMPDGKR